MLRNYIVVPAALKKQSITSKGDSEQVFLLAQAFLNKEFRIRVPEGFGKREGKVGRRIFCTAHFPRRLFALENDLQQHSCVLCMSPLPLHRSFAPCDGHLPYQKPRQGDLPFLESSCRHLTTKSGAFQPLFKRCLNLGDTCVLLTVVFHKCIKFACSQATNPDTVLRIAASLHAFFYLLPIRLCSQKKQV